jgi:hypothetical protein
VRQCSGVSPDGLRRQACTAQKRFVYERKRHLLARPGWAHRIVARRASMER